ncbi:MAG TPA: hypothetical protein P5026_05025 [Kiritimatiellia bacterium]|nr:hypothetical protein [Kiritimatiellia bacterium]HRU70458.1 hypothetical protein [Kiritimatiellia bacterium]
MMRRLVSALMVAGIVCAQPAAQPQQQERVEVSARDSFDGRAFVYTRLLRERNHRHERYDVIYPSPEVTDFEPNNTVPAELYLPLGMSCDRTFPAVVCLHIFHGSFDLERMLCARLAQNGVPAMFFKQPYYAERGGSEGKAILVSNAEIFVRGLEQGLQDARRAVDIMQSLPEVNPARVGVTGVSMGAIQSASVCGIEPRIYKAFLMLGGGDVRQIVMTAHETRKLRAFIEQLPPDARQRVFDCLDRLDPIRARDGLRRLAQDDRLRMTCAELDQVVPPACSRRLAEAAGCADRVTWLKGMDHYSAMASFPQIMEEVVTFFGQDVPVTWQPPQTNGEKSASELVGGFLSGLSALLCGEPVEDRAHMVGGAAEVTVDGKRYAAAFDFLRGTRGRFKLTGTFPEIGKAGLGQGEFPWLIGAGKRVFCGTEASRTGLTAASLIQPQRLMKMKVAAGALAAAAFAPEALKQYYTLGELKRSNGERLVEVNVNHKKARGRLELTFSPDGTPLNASWAFGDVAGTARLSHWRLNAVTDDALFDPPPDLPRQAVLQEDVLRMFAAVFEFAVEATE